MESSAETEVYITGLPYTCFNLAQFVNTRTLRNTKRANE